MVLLNGFVEVIEKAKGYKCKGVNINFIAEFSMEEKNKEIHSSENQ